MRPGRLLAAGLACVGLMAAGGVIADAWLAQPQDARPADPIGDLIRAQDPPAPAPGPAVQETPPSSAPAPAAPVALTPGAPIEVSQAELIEDQTLAEEVEVEQAEPAPVENQRRQRRPVALVRAIDKITAESMTFEVEVGGRPVRFKDALVFSARACEVSAPDERIEDSVAYLEVAIQPRGTQRAGDGRQIFRGWMYASAPAVSGLQHPLYDAWVVGCKA